MFVFGVWTKGIIVPKVLNAECHSASKHDNSKRQAQEQNLELQRQFWQLMKWECSCKDLNTPPISEL